MDAARIASLPELIPAYLQHRLPAARDIRISNLRRNAGGSSRAMWFFNVEATWNGEPPLAPECAFRADDTTCFRDEYGEGLEREFRVYQALASTSVPVPRQYWYETDSRWFGEPFVVREVLPGRSALAREDPALQRKVLENFVDVLAGLHTTDWRATGFDFLEQPSSPLLAASELLDKWDRAVQSELLQPVPLTSAVVAWLRAHIPTHVDRISLNQGQVGPGQFLYDGDARIVAQLDWEQAFLGDPMSDLAYFAFSARSLAADYMDELFARYGRRSGIPVRPANIAFYRVFQSYWGAAHAWTAYNRFALDQHRELQTFSLALTVTQMFPRFTIAAMTAAEGGGSVDATDR